MGRFRITCTRATSMRSWSAARASRRRTTFRRSTTSSITTSRIRSWGSSRARPRTTSAAASRTGRRATTAFSTCRRRTASQVGTGWQIDPGILHAPGSLVTYEPQVNSDLFGMFQSLVEGRVRAVGPAGQGRAGGQASRPRLHRRHARLGSERQSDVRAGQPGCPATRAPLCRERGRRLPRAVGVLRHRLVFREGIDGPAAADGPHSRTVRPTA
jgi:hypothetical protein